MNRHKVRSTFRRRTKNVTHGRFLAAGEKEMRAFEGVMREFKGRLLSSMKRENQ